MGDNVMGYNKVIRTNGTLIRGNGKLIRACDKVYRGLVAQWEYDQNLYDTSGNNYTLNNISNGGYNLNFVYGVGGYCINFDNTDDEPTFYYDAVSQSTFGLLNTFSGSKDFSVCFWLYNTKQRQQHACYWRVGPSDLQYTENAEGLKIMSLGNEYPITGDRGKLNVYIKGAGLPVELYKSTDVLSLSSWYFFSIRRRSNYYSFYLGGEGYSSTTNSETINPQIFYQALSAIRTTDDKAYECLDGRLDQFRIWNRYIENEEVEYWYNGGSGR